MAYLCFADHDCLSQIMKFSRMHLVQEAVGHCGDITGFSLSGHHPTQELLLHQKNLCPS